MIDQKGYENLLNKIKNSKKDFKHRSVDKKKHTFANEIQNNKQIVVNLQKELENYRNYSKKLDSTVILNSIKQKIAKKKLQIKNLTQEIHKIDTHNKKNEKVLVKRLEANKKTVNFKKIIYEVDSHLNRCERLKDQIGCLNNRLSELDK